MGTDTEASLLPATVVVVEDNDINRTLIERVLARRPGLTVLYESDGQRGLDLIRERRPDVVILDLNLPTLDGEAITRELRADPATAAIPILIISGDSTAQSKQRLRAAGADEYFEKPFQILAFLDTINDLLKHR